jgi:hypothetical protein
LLAPLCPERGAFAAATGEEKMDNIIPAVNNAVPPILTRYESARRYGLIIIENIWHARILYN